jgi:hypothetical protein
MDAQSSDLKAEIGIPQVSHNSSTSIFAARNPTTRTFPLHNLPICAVYHKAKNHSETEQQSLIAVYTRTNKRGKMRYHMNRTQPTPSIIQSSTCPNSNRDHQPQTPVMIITQHPSMHTCCQVEPLKPQSIDKNMKRQGLLRNILSIAKHILFLTALLNLISDEDFILLQTTLDV